MITNTQLSAQVVRVSHNKTNTGAPKKGGAGGKGTWGKGGLDDLKTTKLQRQDPNYCSDEEEEIVMTKTEVVSPAVAIIQEYLLSGDADEAAKSLKELNIADTHDQFVKKAIVVAMDHHPYERELISKLLSKFYNDVISADQISAGFQNCLDSIDDLVLDTPDATDVLAKFLARAIVDEIVPPAFFKHARISTPRAEEVLALASGLTTERHRIDRLAHLSSVKRLKEEVNLLLQEYLSNGDMEEADKSVRKLNAPSFHFQLIKQAARLALQLNEEDRKKLSKLLTFFNNTGLVSPDHFERGFRACFGMVKDIALDIPNAEKLLNDLVAMGKEDLYLPQDFQLQ